MKIYIKCSEEMSACRSLITKALADAGHEVLYNAQVRNDAAGQASCDLCIELSAGGLQRLHVQPLSTATVAASKEDTRIQKLVLVIGKGVLPRRAIIGDLHLKQKSRAIFINNYLKPAIAQGFVTMTHPAHPNLPEQMYRLTAKGLALYAALTAVPQ